MRKTKIVCTLGPATDREGVLRQMLEAGMNVARFNFSHGSHAEHKGRLDALKALRAELGLPVAAMLDTKGPEVRLKSFAAGSVMLRTGQEFTLTTRDIVGDEQGCSITYADLPGDVKAGDTILLDDGLVRLTVLETTAADVRCRVENDGAMKNNKGVNVPGIRLSMPYMSQRDREDILFGIEQGFDFIAASFVRTAADVRSAFSHSGGNLGANGSVAYMFDRKGQITVLKEVETGDKKNPTAPNGAAADSDEFEMAVIEAGADDYEEADDEWVVYTEPSDLMAVRSALEEQGIEVKGAELIFEPNNPTAVSIADAKKVQRLIDKLEEFDDVQNVYSTMDITDEVAAALDED